jgi:AhpC/TSA family
MSLVLFIAACYYCVAGILAFTHTEATMLHFGFRPGQESILLNAIGMFYLIFGMAFLLAVRDPINHWRIVAICTGKVLIVCLLTLYTGMTKDLPISYLWFALLDDCIWLIPLLMILWQAVQLKMGRPPRSYLPLTIEQAATTYKLQDGTSLGEAGREQMLVLVFLRHFGCTFTRQLLRSLEQLEKQAQQRGAKLVLIHMLERGEERRFIDDSSAVSRISDPWCELYRAFGLGKAGFWDLFGPIVWVRGFMAIMRGCGVGLTAGDGLQMPGAFLFRNNRILSKQVATTASDLPQLDQLFLHCSEEKTA